MSAGVLLLLCLLLLHLRVVLNRQLRMAAFPAGPQPQVQDGSVPRRTSTPSAGRQCSPPDLNHQLRMAAFPARPQPRAVFPAGPQPRGLLGSVRRPQRAHNHKHTITNTTTTTKTTTSSQAQSQTRVRYVYGTESGATRQPRVPFPKGTGKET